MSEADKYRMLSSFNCNPPADRERVEHVEAEFGVSLPGRYKSFLAKSNGGEGFVGDAYVMLWRAEELLELNKAYQVADYGPGLLSFGSNGGGEAFAFDMRSDK